MTYGGLRLEGMSPTYRRLAKLMAELGWRAVRVRDLNRGGFKDQTRGYVRSACFSDAQLGTH